MVTQVGLLGGEPVVVDLEQIQEDIAQILTILTDMGASVLMVGATTALPILMAFNLHAAMGRSIVEVRARASAATTFVVEDSSDGVAWAVVETLTYTVPNVWKKYAYVVTKPYFRVGGNDFLDYNLELTASRGA